MKKDLSKIFFAVFLSFISLYLSCRAFFNLLYLSLQKFHEYQAGTSCLIYYQLSVILSPLKGKIFLLILHTFKFTLKCIYTRDDIWYEISYEAHFHKYTHKRVYRSMHDNTQVCNNNQLFTHWAPTSPWVSNVWAHSRWTGGDGSRISIAASKSTTKHCGQLEIRAPWNCF